MTHKGRDLPSKYTWPRAVVQEVAEIIRRRRESSHHTKGQGDVSRRLELLSRVRAMEAAFVDTACKTLI